MASERPKASYLAWFKELRENYKILAMLFIALGGYSGLNIWNDVNKYMDKSAPVIKKPDQKPDANYSGFNPGDYALKNHTHLQPAAGLAMKEHIKRDHIKDHAELHQ